MLNVFERLSDLIEEIVSFYSGIFVRIRSATPNFILNLGVECNDFLVLMKEIREEAALEVAITGMVGIFNEETEGLRQRMFHEYRIIFSCTVTGTSVPGNGPQEILATGYFPEASLPPLSKTRTSAEQIRECFRNRHGSAQAVFLN